jgi:hypothetical protein
VPTFNQVSAADNYSDAATIQGVWNPGGGWFSVASNSVFVSLQYPISKGSGYGQAEWTDDQLLGAGAFGFIPSGATGIKFRNAVAGSVAVVTATIAQGNEPALAISSLGSISVSGTAPTQTIITAPGAGTYNTPAACIALLVEVIGAGGAGGTAVATGAGQASCGGGGGGGGYGSAMVAAPLASYAVNVGAAPGGTSSFGAIVQATGGGNGGGAAGTPPQAAAGAVGGLGGGAAGMAGEAGQPGYAGGATTGCYGGAGGCAARGGAGGLATVSVGSNGNPGRAPGGGGAGASNGQNAVQHTGGAGTSGIIIVTEFY